MRNTTVRMANGHADDAQLLRRQRYPSLTATVGDRVRIEVLDAPQRLEHALPGHRRKRLHRRPLWPVHGTAGHGRVRGLPSTDAGLSSNATLDGTGTPLSRQLLTNFASLSITRWPSSARPW